MKLYVVGGCAVVVALVAVIVLQMKPAGDPANEWKRVAVEKETKVRPAYFEQMKFQPGVDVRSPASDAK